MKSFRSNSCDEVIAILPYHDGIVKANVGIDIWAFGLLLYYLYTGQPLLPVNRDDDLADAESMMRAASWSDRELERKIEAMHVMGETNVDSLKELLKKILKVNPADRPISMEDILDHPFFRGGDSSKAILQQIVQEGMQEVMKEVKQGTAEVVETVQRENEKLQKGVEDVQQTLDNVQITLLTVKETRTHTLW